jgi:hypothetical protein
MGQVNATIFLEDQGPERGYGYSRWIFDLGKGEGPVDENVTIVCAETSQRYMTQEEAVNEAKNRLMVKIERECGNIPENKIKWRVIKVG